MTLSHNLTHRRRGLGRMLGLGLAVALLANFGDRAFMASSDNNGIDPLQILDTEVKNNILFMISTSDTLAGTPEGSTAVVGGDDPASRLYQVKRAMRTIIAENQGKANFGVASFHPEPAEHAINDANGLVYVTQDPTGNNFRNEFDRSGGSALAISFGGWGTCTGNVATCAVSSATYVPPANSLLVVFATATGGTDTTAINGHGLAAGSYVKVSTGTLTADNHQMSVWVAKAGATPTNAAATMSSGGRPQTIHEYVITGADVGGTAAQAIAQVVTSNGTSATAATTLAAASNVKNAAMYFAVHDANTNTTPASGWTEGSDTFSNTAHSQGSNDAGVSTQYNTAFSTAASATFTSTVWRGIAIEVKAAAEPAVIDSCAGACTAAESAVIFDLLKSNDAGTANKYPATCTDQSSDQVAVGGTPNAPITHVLNTNCRYYIRSKAMLNGKRYTVNRSAAANAAITTSTAITCPAPPPGLLGDDTLAAADGSKPRACFQLQDITPTATNRITTYWLTGTQFNYAQVTAPSVTTPAASCNETGLNVDVAECNGADNSATLQALTRLELQYDATSGAPLDIAALTSVGGLKPGNPTYTNVGIRAGTGSPITKALTWALNYFRTTVLPVGGTTKRPVAAQGKQKQFVVLVVDADDTCNTLAEAQAAAYALYSNTLPALPSCTANCGTLGDLTPAQWLAANRIELFVVPFGGGTQASMDAIAAAGSGKNPAQTACDLGGTCRSAPIATNLSELTAALRTAVFSGTGTGTFSDQQSVTETLFEFASLATPSKDPLDPFERYAVAIPVLLQSTFEMPDFKGHLNAVRRNNNGSPDNPDDDFQQVEWDAGQKLYNRVQNGVTAGTGLTVGTAVPFATLYGNAANAATPVKTSTAKIKRRIFTTLRNGVNANYTVTNLLAANFTNLAGPSGGFQRVSLWPPTTGTADNSVVAPTATFASSLPVRGILDTAMGFDAWTTVAQVQAAVPGACQGAGAHADCTSATAGLPLARAKREAREIILAYLAGAKVKTANGVPVRVSGELQYEVRPWIMVESTLASPGVVTPPLLAGPADGEFGAEEYKYYRDGLRNTSTKAPINGVLNGVGLRNPDRVDTSASQAVIDAAYANLDVKPSMSVVYHSTNHGLHAFRAGPCPAPPSGSGISSTAIPCAGETGGEEMWAFVPFDVLYKLPALTIAQTRANKQYLLAAPVRFADVFIPGAGTFNGTTFTGVWRVLLYFGRGQGGKYLTALDVTTPGPFTRHSLDTTDPIVVWSRGNPDTTLGLPCATGTPNYSAADCTAYNKMGETWSVPAMGYVTATSYTTARTGTAGTNFVLFTGSGYSDVVGEGKTFFVLDALNGDVINTFDIADNGSVPAQTPPLTNFLVASPVSYQEDASGNSPAGYQFLGNPITVKTTKVYFPDLHGRIWRYDATTPGTAPVAFFTADVAVDGNQPFATAVSVQQNRPDSSAPGEILVYAEAGHDRRVPTDVTKPFKAYAIKDNGTPGEVIFTQNFPDNYRGTVQPASAFAGTTAPLTPVVFYAGIKFNAGCVPTFDSILFALRGITAVPGTPEAAFDLKATGDDAFIEIAGSKVQAIRVSGEGSLVIDQGLSAQNVPPPPGVPVPTVPIPGVGGVVRQGLTPNTQDYRDLVATTQPYRVGSSVCRVEAQ